VPSSLSKLYGLYAFDVSLVLTHSGPGRCWNTKPGPDRDGASAMTDPTDPAVSWPEPENRELVVRVDLGGWISGPCLPVEPADRPKVVPISPDDSCPDGAQESS
jgi:hypothetical protein